jgi:hypothetical protein
MKEKPNASNPLKLGDKTFNLSLADIIRLGQGRVPASKQYKETSEAGLAASLVLC